jgi:hypothetical protein
MDGIALLSWCFCGPGDELKVPMKDIFDSIFFYGNKVLKMDKPLDTAWFEAYKDLFSAHYRFLMNRADSITNWTGKEDPKGAEAAFKAGSVETPVVAAKVAVKVEEVKI